MNDEVEIDVLALLRKNWVVLLVVTLVVGLLTFALSWLLPNKYTASTAMYVLAQKEEDGSTSPTQSDFSTAQLIANDISRLIDSTRVKNDVASALGFEDIEDYEIKVGSDATSRVITVDVTSTDAETVAQVANEIVSKVSQVATDAMRLESIYVVDDAVTPDEPSGPNRIQLGIIGALVGLVLTFAVIVVRDMVDTRVRTSNELEEIVGVPVVGHFPDVVR